MNLTKEIGPCSCRPTWMASALGNRMLIASTQTLPSRKAAGVGGAALGSMPAGATPATPLIALAARGCGVPPRAVAAVARGRPSAGVVGVAVTVRVAVTVTVVTEDDARALRLPHSEKSAQ